MNDKILHLPAAKLADVSGNGFGTKMHVGSSSSNNEILGITSSSSLSSESMMIRFSHSSNALSPLSTSQSLSTSASISSASFIAFVHNR